MNRRKIAAGPGASSLILIAVVLALSVLTVLTMISARNDDSLSSRSMETRYQVYGMFNRGEKQVAALDSALLQCLKEHPEEEDFFGSLEEYLPEGMTLDEHTVSWRETEGDRSLECAVEVFAPGGEKRFAWREHRLTSGAAWEEDEWGDDWD